MEGFSVASYRREYRVEFTNDAVDALAKLLKPGDCVLVDETVHGIFTDRLGPVLEGRWVIPVRPEEPSKSFDGVRSVIARLIQGGFRKNNRLIAIGGGITQDVTAFVASVLYRGVDWFFFPTNLLSQCDSCIGSKTSINFEDAKNQLGGFFPPTGIFIDTTFLETLPESEIRSGLGEMAHYFLIDGEPAFTRFEAELPEALTRGPSLLRLIGESLAIKKRMIEIDEFDEGPRNVFNFGHSFGHALEGVTRYAIPHGIAVSFGMDIANSVSAAYGLIDASVRDRARACLQTIWCKTPFPDVTFEGYIPFLRKDKKNTDLGIRVILTRGFGDMFLTRIEEDEDLRRVVGDCFSFFRESTRSNEN